MLTATLFRPQFVHNGELYNLVCGDGQVFLERMDFGGKILDCFNLGHFFQRGIGIWNGALLTVEDGYLWQWTPCSPWTPSTHKVLPKVLQRGIKAMMMVASRKGLVGSLPKDILFVVFQFYASSPYNSNRKRIKRRHFASTC